MHLTHQQLSQVPGFLWGTRIHL